MLELISHKTIWKTYKHWVAKEFSGKLNSEILCFAINKGRSNHGDNKYGTRCFIVSENKPFSLKQKFRVIKTVRTYLWEGKKPTTIY